MTHSTRRLAIGLFLLAGFILGAGAANATPLKVSVGKVQAAAGAEVQIPITIKGVKDNKGLSCLSFRLSYDPALLKYQSVEKGAVLPGATFGGRVDEEADPGLLGLGFACGSKAASGGEKEMASVETDGVVL